MNKKLTVTLLVGGAVLAAGYVLRKPLGEQVDNLLTRANEYLDNRDQVNASEWLYRDDPEADPVPNGTAAQ